jgi:hypothetical protein
MCLQLGDILVVQWSLLVLKEKMPDPSSVNCSWATIWCDRDAQELLETKGNQVGDFLLPSRVFLSQLIHCLAVDVLHNDVPYT